MNRRTLIGGTAVGAAMSALAASAGASEALPQNADRSNQEVAAAVKELRGELTRLNTFWEIASVREAMFAFLRANNKFPDFVEVGSGIWQQVYDWHVRYQQPLALGRMPDGRYTIGLMGTTTVVLRQDVMATAVLAPYDNR